MAGNRILLVEDDPSLGFVIKDNLEQDAFEVTLADNGKDGYECFLKQPYDLCLLDIMLPKKDGLTLAEDIRKADENIPLIFITAKSMEEDRIKGLKTGADDYITKPFSMEELVLRIKAVLKRSQKQEKEEHKDIFTIGEYRFDHKNLLLQHPAGNKTLTKKEADLLRLLCLHENSVLERQTALKVVWGEDDYFLGRSMDVFIARLRKYLKNDPSLQIVNVHGVGFKLEKEPKAV